MAWIEYPVETWKRILLCDKCGEEMRYLEGPFPTNAYVHICTNSKCNHATEETKIFPVITYKASSQESLDMYLNDFKKGKKDE